MTMCKQTSPPLSADDLRNVHRDVLDGKPVEPAARAEVRDAYAKAADSKANRDMRMMAAKLQEIADLMGAWTDEHADGAFACRTECDFCAIYEDYEGGYVHET